MEDTSSTLGESIMVNPPPLGDPASKRQGFPPRFKRALVIDWRPQISAYPTANSHRYGKPTYIPSENEHFVWVFHIRL